MQQPATLNQLLAKENVQMEAGKQKRGECFPMRAALWLYVQIGYTQDECLQHRVHMYENISSNARLANYKWEHIEGFIRASLLQSLSAVAPAGQSAGTSKAECCLIQAASHDEPEMPCTSEKLQPKLHLGR